MFRLFFSWTPVTFMKVNPRLHPLDLHLHTYTHQVHTHTHTYLSHPARAGCPRFLKLHGTLVQHHTPNSAAAAAAAQPTQSWSWYHVTAIQGHGFDHQHHRARYASHPTPASYRPVCFMSSAHQWHGGRSNELIAGKRRLTIFSSLCQKIVNLLLLPPT